MTIAEPHSPSLAQLVREGSQAEHTDTESSAFMSELLAGRINAQGYADYLASLRRVYEAMERVGRSLGGHPLVGGLIDPALERLEAIDADLAHWGPGDGQTPATDAYVDRVEATEVDPPRFIAHHYTRYLGDLSGGRAIGSILRREFGLGDGPGAAFYHFSAIPKPKPYKDGYRARLDGLDLSSAQRAEVLEEVKIAFTLNGAVFAELGQRLESYRR